MPADEMNALLDANRRWAQETELNDPGFFQRSARGQRPNVSPFHLLGNRSAQISLAEPLDRLCGLESARECGDRSEPRRHLCPSQCWKVRVLSYQKRPF